MKDVTQGLFRVPDETKIFDERRQVEGTGVKRITIDSEIADVNITSSNSTKVEVHLYGMLVGGEGVDFEVFMVKDELKVVLKCVDYYLSELKLDISIPYKMFKVIAIRTVRTDITLDKAISTEYLNLEVKLGDGNIETKASFHKASIVTAGGNIELYIDAHKDIEVKIASIAGDIFVAFDNIGRIELSPRTKKRKVKNHHKGRVGHTASVDICTKFGEIKFG